MKGKARARTGRPTSATYAPSNGCARCLRYACAQAHVIGVCAWVRHVHLLAEVSIWSSVACTQYKSSLRRSNYMWGLSSSQLEPRLYCQARRLSKQTRSVRRCLSQHQGASCRSMLSQSFWECLKEKPGRGQTVLELRYTLPALAVRDASCVRAHKLTLLVYVMLCGTSTCLRRSALVVSCLHSVRIEP